MLVGVRPSGVFVNHMQRVRLSLDGIYHGHRTQDMGYDIYLMGTKKSSWYSRSLR